MAVAGIITANAQTVAESALQDSLFVYLQGGRLDVYPPSVVSKCDDTGAQLVVTTIDGKAHAYARTRIDSVTSHGPAEMPVFTSFKFNNKFNGQVFKDVECEIGADGLITGSVPAIGKWLTPSFQRSDSTSLVYVGRKLQHSKESRLSFAEPVEYVVTKPGWQIMTLSKPDEEVVVPDPVVPDPLPQEIDENAEKIILTADMLSTNAPTTIENEDLPSLIDGYDNTFFHSTWSGSGYPTLPLDSCPWIEVNLPESVHRLQFRYETRNAEQRWPTGLRVDVSADGEEWLPVQEFTSETDGLPATVLTWWTSPAIDLGGDYSHLRIVCTQAAYKNYLCMAELEFYRLPVEGSGGSESEPEPEPTLQEGETLDFQPFGTHYTVSVDWPTDRSVNVPTIYITTDIGRRPYDKVTYLSGTFRIDGAGVFPDMEETTMQIKGRGNSSWAGEWGKSPYRLKFDSKVKPFGMTKGKSWVLLANRINGSMMTNAIGMKVAQLAGAAGANHIVPVELYINGEYCGSYNFTEKTGFHNNSIDLEDDTYAALLELDTYTDETIYYSRYYSVPVKYHEPDFEDPETVTPLTPSDIMADFNEMLGAARNGEDICRWVEVDTFSAFYLTNEYIMNQELFHPKSTFLYKEVVGDPSSLWKFGPVWDLDWSFGHEMNGGYFTTGDTSDYLSAKTMENNSMWRALRRAGETLDRAYYKAWTRFLRRGGVEEMVDFCQEYYDYANPSFLNNGDYYNYSRQVGQAQSWLKRRAEYIYSQLNTYDLSDELPEDAEWQPYEDSDEPVKPTVTQQQYEDALRAIDTELRYRIFTTFDGAQFTDDHKYYLTRDGRLTEELNESDVYVFTLTEGTVGTGNKDLFVSPGWRTDAYFTNPTLSEKSTGDIVSRGYISTNTSQARDNWEGQVWYLQDDRFAVRATNAPAGSWGAETYWTVEDIEEDGVPEAGYSWTPGFYWQLEEAVLDGILRPATADVLATAPVYDLTGRRVADRFDHFCRLHRPGVYIVAGRKVTLR